MRGSATRLITYALAAFLLSSLSLPFGIREANAAQTTQVILYPTADAYIDSGNANTNYGSSTALATLAYSAYLGLSTRYMQSWLKFDLSGIPPAATVASATLTLRLSYSIVYAIVGVYGTSDSSWTESGITWNNAPMSSVSGSSTDTQYVTNSTSTYNWSVTSLVSGGPIGSGSIVFVLKPTSTQSSNSNGWAVYYSKEGGSSSNGPSLSITYSYVSTSVSLGSSSIQYGNSVTIVGNTDPTQSGGTTTLQYSTNQVGWSTIASSTGGTYTYPWTPPSAGAFYMRSSWSITWSGGSYSATSGTSQFVVNPAPSTVQLLVAPSTTTPLGTVSLQVSLTPPVSDGTMTLQYSTNQVSWIQISSGTPSSGSFSSTWSPGVAGTYYVRVIWSGDTNYLSVTSAVQTVTVSKLSSTIQLGLSTNSITPTGSVTLTAAITPQASDGTVSFQYSSDQNIWTLISAVTPSSGAASYAWSPNMQGYFYIRATWSGDTNYLSATSSSQTLSIGLTSTSMTLSSPTSARLDDTVSLTATLRDSSNNPVVGETVSFTFDSIGIGSAMTGSSGSATLSYKLATNAGSHVVTASYSGSNTYKSSSAQSGLTVSPWKLIITSTVSHAPLIRFNGANYTTDVSGKVVISVNSTSVYALQINSPLVTATGTRAVFVQWGDGIAVNAKSINVNTDISLSVTTKVQYYLTVNTTYGSATGTGWYDAGTTPQFSVQSPVDQGNGTRRIFTSWVSGGSSVSTSSTGSLQMNTPTTVTAEWKTQFYLTVSSPYGNPSGAGWHDSGSTATASVTSPAQAVNTTRYVTTGFSGSGSAPQSGTGTSVTFVITSPSSLTFQWKTQYFVRVTTSFDSASGEGWYDNGTQATVTIKDTTVPENPLVSKVFTGWSGDASGKSQSITVEMNGPKQIVASWADNYTNLYLAAGGTAAVVGVASVVYFMRKGGHKPT